MKRFSWFSLGIAASALLLLNASDAATVVKASRRFFGFSPDSRHYIYLESTRNPVTDVPMARLQIVNVATNSCVENGCIETEYDNSASNISNRAAEEELLRRTIQLRQTLRLNQLKVGISLPIISRSSYPGGTEILQVRVNNQTDPLQIRLEQRYMSPTSPGGTIGVERASMRLVINSKYSQLTLGDLNNYREAVKKYSIREVRLSPDKRNIVVLIDMIQPTYEGVLQTTFLQSFPLM
ncbi:MAG: DUF2259 domain-containing protein [Coleofasciculus sp. S288]|nr:DUF2259 domain-containing protein [Coleofasciculus sp. S288]